MIKSSRASTAGARNIGSQNISSFLQQQQNQQLDTIRKDKNQQYLTPRHQSRSAQGSRNQLTNQKNSNNFGAQSQRKIQSKVPILTNFSKQEELKKRITKLGLESFMKEIVLSDKISDPHFSSKVIHALNKTYLMNDLLVPKNQMPITFGKRTLRQSRKVQNLKVQWNPQKQFIQEQFKGNDIFIPNSMFPKRQNQATKLIKNRQKKNIQLYRKNFSVLARRTQHSTTNISTNLDENLKNFHLANRSASQNYRKSGLWKSTNLNENSFYLNKSKKIINEEIKNQYQKQKRNQTLIFGRKARIYV